MRVPYSTDAVARLKGKYGWSGGPYRALISDIITANDERISRAVGRLKIGAMKAKAATFTTRWKRLVLPDISEALPKRSVFIRKGAERGKVLTDELRARLSRDLRDSMLQFATQTGEQAFSYRTGTVRGRMNPRLADVFERKILDTFESYTKRDPETGVPANIRTIAVTETRAAVNEVKAGYFARLAAKNPDLEIVKRWKHNPHLSSTEPRPGHAEMDGAEVAMDAAFEVPEWQKLHGRWVRTWRIWRMMHPHDPTAPAQEVISCHCDCDYVARRW